MPNNNRDRVSKSKAIEIGVVLAILVGLAAMLIPEYERQREYAKDLEEARQPGLVFKQLAIYASKHEGKFPPRSSDACRLAAA